MVEIRVTYAGDGPTWLDEYLLDYLPKLMQQARDERDEAKRALRETDLDDVAEIVRLTQTKATAGQLAGRIERILHAHEKGIIGAPLQKIDLVKPYVATASNWTPKPLPLGVRFTAEVQLAHEQLGRRRSPHENTVENQRAQGNMLGAVQARITERAERQVAERLSEILVIR
jgi:hypothetical protein